MPYPAERGADDVACPTPFTEEAAAYTHRAAHHLQGSQPRRPEARHTPAMEAVTTPQRGPAPHRRSRRRHTLQHVEEVEVAAAIPLSRALPDLS
jgi:hypothetical protein